MGEECGDGPSTIAGWLSIAEPRLGKISVAKHAIELGHDAHWTASQVGQLLAKEWKLPRPRVILSIVSGTKSYGKYGKDKTVETAMQEGLIKAMKTTQCWVLTNGLDGGMSKILGDALESELKLIDMKRRFHAPRTSRSSTSPFQPVLIGIARKSVLKYDSFSLTSSSRSSPAVLENEGRANQRHRRRFDGETSFASRSTNADQKFELNPAHTHFILVRSDQKSAVSRVWNDVVEKEQPSGAAGLGASPRRRVAGRGRSDGGDRGGEKGRRKRTELEKLHPMNLIENPLGEGAHDEVDRSPSSPSDSDDDDDDDWFCRDDVSVPLICILVKGGVFSLRLAKDHLARGTPVVVIGGTGGAASVLELAIRIVGAGVDLAADRENSAVGAIKKLLIDNQLVACPTSSDLSAIVEVVVACVSSDYVASGLLSLVSSSSVDELRRLDRHLLKSLLRAQRRDLFARRGGGGDGGGVGETGGDVDASVVVGALKRDFLLTVDWNQPDIAEKFIFNEFRSWMSDVECPISYRQFERILLNPGYDAFVDLCLAQKNFSLSHQLTLEAVGNLFTLCTDRDIFDAICLSEILGLDSEELKTTDFIPHRLNDLVYKLVSIPNYVKLPKTKAKPSDGRFFRNLAMFDRFFAPTPPDVKMLLFPPHLYSSSSPSPRSAEEDAKHLLFLWSVLMCKPGLAFIIWKHLEDPIPSALAAAILFRNMATFSTTVYLKDQLEKDSQFFVGVAVGVLNAGFEGSDRELDDLPYNLFDSRAVYWGNRYIIDIAYDAEARDFFSHPCCQRYLTARMYGHLQIRSLHFGFLTIPRWLKVILSAVFILPMFFWIRFVVSPRAGTPAPPSSNRGSACPESSLASNRKREPPVIDDDELSLPDQDDGDGALVSDVLLRRILRPQPIPFFRRLRLLWAAPATKMWVSMISYIVFLLSFHVALLVPGCGNEGLDLFLFIWTITILIEMARHILFMKRKYEFFSALGNVIEIIIIVFFLIAFLLFRLIPHFASSSSSMPDPFVGRVAVALGLLFFHYRFMFSFLTVSSRLGPLVLALKTLIGVDFVSFLRLLILTAAPSAIAVQALLFPGWPLSASSVFQAFRRATFSLFTIALDDLGGRTSCSVPPNATDISSCASSSHAQLYSSEEEWSCPQSNFWPWFFWTQYLVLQKVVLMSLLYALFSTTMAKIKNESQALWLFRRYQVICKFEKSPPLPPPLSPLCYLYDCLSFWLNKKCFSACCLRKGGGCCGGGGGCCRHGDDCCGCCFGQPVGNGSVHADDRHEAFFWSQTRQAYLADKSEKERKREEKDKFLHDLSETVSANLLLSKTLSKETGIPFKELMAEALTCQRTVGTLEASLKDKEAENHRLLDRIDRLNDEVERLKLLAENVNDEANEREE